MQPKYARICINMQIKYAKICKKYAKTQNICNSIRYNTDDNTLQYGRNSNYNYNITMLQYCTIPSYNTDDNIVTNIVNIGKYCNLYCHAVLYNIVTL